MSKEETPVNKAIRELCQFVSARNDWWRVYHIALAEARAKPKQAAIWAKVAAYAKWQRYDLLAKEEGALVEVGILLSEIETSRR